MPRRRKTSAGGRALKKGQTALKKIVAEAQRIRRKNPSMKWKTAIQEGTKAYHAGKL